MKLVQFRNGKWAARIFTPLGFSFIDLRDREYCWKKNEDDFEDCLADSEEEIMEKLRVGPDWEIVRKRKP